MSALFLLLLPAFLVIAVCEVFDTFAAAFAGWINRLLGNG